jgi:hypothetical protein
LTSDLPGVNPATLNGMILYYRLMNKWGGLGDSTELSRVGLSPGQRPAASTRAPPAVDLASDTGAAGQSCLACSLPLAFVPLPQPISPSYSIPNGSGARARFGLTLCGPALSGTTAVVSCLVKEWRPKHDTMAIFSCCAMPKHDGVGRRARVVPGTMASLRFRVVNPTRGAWEGNLCCWAAASSAIGRGTAASKLWRDPPWDHDLRRHAATRSAVGGRPLPPGRRESLAGRATFVVVLRRDPLEGQSGRQRWCF